MSHRSVLVREPPVGHGFDPHPPGLADVVRSLNETSAGPRAFPSSSNAGVTVVGYVPEQRAGQPFCPVSEKGRRRWGSRRVDLNLHAQTSPAA